MYLVINSGTKVSLFLHFCLAYSCSIMFETKHVYEDTARGHGKQASISIIILCMVITCHHYHHVPHCYLNVLTMAMIILMVVASGTLVDWQITTSMMMILMIITYNNGDAAMLMVIVMVMLMVMVVGGG